MPKAIEKNSNLIVISLIALYVVFFLSVTLQRYFHLLYQDMDLALINQVFWNTLHGKAFYSSIRGGIILKDHLFWIVYALLPFYKLHQHPTTLLFFQALFLGLAAWPLYLIAREKLGNTLAVIIAFLYLIYPATGYGNIYDFHLETMLPVLLFFSFYYFLRQRLGGFLVCLLLCFMVKEDMALAGISFGIASLFMRRSKKWVLWPLALGLGYGILAFKVLIPHFNGSEYIFSAYYPDIKEIISHPVATIKFAFIQPKLIYLVKLFAPLGFLALASPVVLIGAPFFLEALLSKYAPLYQINFYYGLSLAPFIFVATIFSLQRLKKFRFTGVLLLVIGLAANVIIGPHVSLARSVFERKADYLLDYQRELIKKIPEDKAVVATFGFLAELSNREEVYSFHYVYGGFDKLTNKTYKLPDTVEYALLDFQDQLTFQGFDNDTSPANINRFLEQGRWGVEEVIGPLVMLKRNSETKMRLINPIESELVGEQKLNIVNYQFEVDQNDDNFIIIALDWHVAQDLDKKYLMQLALADENNQELGRYYFDPTYNIYPTQLWKQGQHFRTYYRLPKITAYELLVFDPQTKEVLAGVRIK